MYYTLEQFWKTNKYDVGWLVLLTSLDKIVEEKNELRDLNPQFKHCINDQTASMCVLKKSLISYNHEFEIAVNKMQNLIL